MSKFILPRPHLSWSSIDCWNRSPERFRREYFENGKKLDTKYLRFGSGIGKLVENGKHKELLPDLIVYKEVEFEIRCEIMGVPMLMYLDSYDPEMNVFTEMKTGKIPWTQAKVQKHDQLVVYAAGIKCLTGKIPEYCDLHWIETREGGGEVQDFWRSNEKDVNVTGKIVTFRREFDEREIDRMEFVIQKAAEEISEAYQEFIKEI